MHERDGNGEVVDDLEDVDPGLAADRTMLAWRRTAISYAGVGAVISKVAPAAGIPVVAMAVVIWVIGARWAARGPASRPLLRQASRLRLITAMTVTVSIAALSIAVLTSAH